MSLISAKSIKKPNLKVTPPLWVKITLGSILILVCLAIFLSPSLGSGLKTTILSIYTVVLLVLAVKALDKDYLVTMRVNRDGIYFKSDKARSYFFVPWRCVGSLEKAPFPLNKRTLQIEITGDYKNSIGNSEHVANVMWVGDKIYVYAIPQLNNRDRLIEKMLNYKRPVFE